MKVDVFPAPDDARTALFLRECYRDSFNLRLSEDELAERRKRSSYFIAQVEEDGRHYLAGMCRVGKVEHEDGTVGWQVWDLAVPNGGRGIGSILLDSVSRRSLADGANYVEVLCAPERAGFYERNGFKVDRVGWFMRRTDG